MAKQRHSQIMLHEQLDYDKRCNFCSWPIFVINLLLELSERKDKHRYFISSNTMLMKPRPSFSLTKYPIWFDVNHWLRWNSWLARDKTVIAHVAGVIPLSHKTSCLLIQRYGNQAWWQWPEFGRRCSQMHLSDSEILYFGSSADDQGYSGGDGMLPKRRIAVSSNN